MRTILLSNANEFNYRADNGVDRHVLKKLADFYGKNSSDKNSVVIISKAEDNIKTAQKIVITIGK